MRVTLLPTTTVDDYDGLGPSLVDHDSASHLSERGHDDSSGLMDIHDGSSMADNGIAPVASTDDSLGVIAGDNLLNNRLGYDVAHLRDSRDDHLLDLLLYNLLLYNRGGLDHLLELDYRSDIAYQRSGVDRGRDDGIAIAILSMGIIGKQTEAHEGHSDQTKRLHELHHRLLRSGTIVCLGTTDVVGTKEPHCSIIHR